jgi:xanthine dehydrogenase iron-sulfur cluster and FAD-binding subunit A
MWNRYISATNLDEVVDALDHFREKARVVAGATDLMLELERGSRPDVSVLVDISRIQGINQISEDENHNIHLGPLVTHNDCVATEIVRNCAYPLARAAWEVGSPQIRNRGTVAGNLVTASPANDTVTPLMALNARVVLRSKTGERVIALSDFYMGVRKTVMRADELVVDIFFPKMKPNQRGCFIKYALRNAQAISLVNVAVILGFDADKKVESAQITLGAVAPTIIHARGVEEFLLGRELDDGTIRTASELVMSEIRPIDDLRGTARYRKAIAGVITRRALTGIWHGSEQDGMPKTPVLLRSVFSGDLLTESVTHEDGVDIFARVNGKEMLFHHGQGKSLLRLLREEGLLVGTKEGCSEGECGACTVHLDGAAVMSCMVPAPRAHGATIETVEGLAQDGSLHPIQRAFMREGAVQCGYCTPGFLMAGAMLMKERKVPTQAEIKQAFTGNLCRCTGYYKIIKAVESAVQEGDLA